MEHQGPVENRDLHIAFKMDDASWSVTDAEPLRAAMEQFALEKLGSAARRNDGSSHKLDEITLRSDLSRRLATALTLSWDRRFGAAIVSSSATVGASFRDVF